MGIKHHNIADLRQDYTKASLDEKSACDNPIQQFENWLQEAIQQGVTEPTAMSVSTVDELGRPSSRIVLLKDVQEDKFYFFTNYLSKKGKDIEGNTYICLLFFWPELQRQVRVLGRANKAQSSISDEYFASRPRESRIGAIASPQSHKINERAELERKVHLVTDQFEDMEEIPRPDFWGGYEVVPEYLEFWQGGANRLHDRVVYEIEQGAEGRWHKYRIAP